MGLQGPLTAQALGRSPYDDVVQGEGEEGPGEGAQQYDHRGRPINPESKRINRDIIRSHNEVMLVVGVAEPENPHSAPEYEAKRQHDAYEHGLGIRLIWATKRCVEMVGVFGVSGLRQRILVYKQYSHTPCWELYRAARANFSVSRDLLAGAPSNLLADYIDRRFIPRWFLREEKSLVSRCIDNTWIYLRLHLELYAAFQRLGLVRSSRLLPSLKYFVPFTEDSPIPAPPPLEDLSCRSVFQWLGGVFISATPFLLWAMMQRLRRDWQPGIWQQIISSLPSPIFRPRGIGPLPPAQATEATDTEEGPEADGREEPMDVEGDAEDGPQLPSEDGPLPTQQPELSGRQSVYSAAGGDDDGSDDDDNEVVSATLISFDVEATEATDVPQGVWSAELRPSAGPEARIPGAPLPTYLSTMLTRLPAMMAAKVIGDSILRFMIAPYEAMALRLAARAFCLRGGLPCSDILNPNLLSGINMTWAVNYLGSELTHLVLTGEVWSALSVISQCLHFSEQEWNDFEGKEWGDWFGPFYSNEPLF